jgi:HSP20 family protein
MLFRSSDLLADFERLTRGLNLGSEFDEVVDNLSNGFKAAGESNKFATPGVDAVSTASGYEFYIDLPGVDPSSVELTVDGRVVTITASREFNVADDAELVHAGRRHGSFSRSFRLGPDVDAEGLSARSEHGVLIVTVPKIEAPQPRKIEITTTD